VAMCSIRGIVPNSSSDGHVQSVELDLSPILGNGQEQTYLRETPRYKASSSGFLEIAAHARTTAKPALALMKSRRRTQYPMRFGTAPAFRVIADIGPQHDSWIN